MDEIGLNAIIISHNHRDHVDVKSLKIFTKMECQPKLIVPQGDKKLFEKMGFKNVIELKWYEQYNFKDEGISITACPSDHWSGRGLFDAEHSATNGYLINDHKSENIVYFAGDTAKLEDSRIDAIAKLTIKLKDQKDNGFKNDDCKIVNIEPDGPNYSRKDMESTHQSILESIMSSYRLSIAIGKDNKEECKKYFNKNIKLIITHHNKFQLGPDRFNEGVNIIQKLLNVLNSVTNIEKAREILNNNVTNEKERNNKVWFDILQYNDTFIYEQGLELLDLAEKIFSTEGALNAVKQNLQDILNYSFPKIGGRVVFSGYRGNAHTLK